RVRHRGGGGGGAVGAVDDDAEAVELRRHGLRQVEEVAVQPVGRFLDDAADAGAGRAGVLQAVERVLDFLLHRVVELGAAGGEELDAVVGHRVVGGGDHHADVGAVIVGEVRDGRGRQHAHAQHVDALGGEAGGQRG